MGSGPWFDRLGGYGVESCMQWLRDGGERFGEEESYNNVRLKKDIKTNQDFFKHIKNN
jgi:hypothetical protein